MTGLKYRVSYHIRFREDSKFRQNRRGDVGQGGRLGRNLSVAEQDAGNQPEIDTMIAAPGVVVVLQFVGREGPQDRFPSGPVSAVVANQHVRP